MLTKESKKKWNKILENINKKYVEIKIFNGTIWLPILRQKFKTKNINLINNFKRC